MSDLGNNLVSVVMITYGHEKFIREAVEGVLMQNCDFEVELIIADDKSPDNTEKIVRDIIENHPKGNWIKYTKHFQNKGMIPNFMWALEQAKGKYISLCEGDDYWNNPFKLSKQIRFLENNSDYTFSMGRVNVLIEKTGKIIKRKDGINISNKKEFIVKDYIRNPFSQTSSFLFKNNNLRFPEWFHKIHAGDQAIVVLMTGLGKIKYHAEIFSTYRINDKSVSYNRDISKIKDEQYLLLDSLNRHTGFRYNRYIILRKIIFYFELNTIKFKNKTFFLYIINLLIFKIINFFSGK